MGTETPGGIDSTKIYHFIKAQGRKESSEGCQVKMVIFVAWLYWIYWYGEDFLSGAAVKMQPHVPDVQLIDSMAIGIRACS